MDDPDRKPTSPAPIAGFEFNNPTIISLLYLASYVTGGLTGIIGVVLAFVWRGDPRADWEVSHYQYHINSFWIAIAGTVAGMLLMIVLIGFLLIAAVAILVIVRSVLSLLNAQKHLPMPNPGSWTI
ncbi:Uncharacterized membrane protein [Novosphingobium sp. CF614]|uniref:DUF4870 family protein n=1 Tax=Novosphingobium sp. CF614 TaxID=1884364 RepID=UPI0008EFB6D5|nr:hypothetical protein [Novosphingobium sp. CF614]SFF76744.1 Uncharacterized membrane protein [Novosphingobium sp. CF614]